MLPSAADLIDALAKHRRPTSIIRVTPLGENRAVFTVRLGDATVQFTVSIHEVIGLVPSAKRKRLSRGQARSRIHTAMQDAKSWTEEELRREGLPLYWSEAWLKRMFEQYGSFVAAAEASGYGAQTLNNYAVKRFGWSQKPRKAQLKARVIEDWRTSGDSLEKVAARHGVNKATVYRWTVGMERSG
jgi:hypothetical protein